MSKNNCYNCKYKNNVAGNTHVSCNYPLMSEKERSLIQITALTSADKLTAITERGFGFSVSDHPVHSGWFAFPSNFDPNWIEGECNKHSNLVGEEVNFHLISQKSMSNYSLMLVTQKNTDIITNDDFEIVLNSYQDAIDFASKEENKTEDRIIDARKVFLEKLIETDKLYLKYEIEKTIGHLRAKIKT